MRISDWSSDVCSSDLAVGEFDHFAGLDIVEAVDAGDAVADREHGADFADRGVSPEIGDLVLDDLADFSGADFHCLAFHREFGRTCVPPFITWAKLLRRVRMLPSLRSLPSLTTRPPRMAASSCVASSFGRALYWE